MNQLVKEKESIVYRIIFVLVDFLATLKGEDIFKLVLGETWDYLVEGRKTIKLPRVLLPLRGRFKGETGENFHFVVVTTKSCSGLEIGTWL